jgi:hypothetical protein
MTHGDGAAGDVIAPRFAVILTVTAHGPRRTGPIVSGPGPGSMHAHGQHAAVPQTRFPCLREGIVKFGLQK